MPCQTVTIEPPQQGSGIDNITVDACSVSPREPHDTQMSSLAANVHNAGSFEAQVDVSFQFGVAEIGAGSTTIQPGETNNVQTTVNVDSSLINTVGEGQHQVEVVISDSESEKRFGCGNIIIPQEDSDEGEDGTNGGDGGNGNGGNGGSGSEDQSFLQEHKRSIATLGALAGLAGMAVKSGRNKK